MGATVVSGGKIGTTVRRKDGGYCRVRRKDGGYCQEEGWGLLSCQEER